MNKTIAIIAAHGMAFELANAMAKLSTEKDLTFVFIGEQQKEEFKIKEDWKVEPLVITNYNLSEIEPIIYYDHQPSKFFSKPKNNFKK